EFGVRIALGAGRGRLVRQLLTESLFLASMGGVAGMAVAMAGERALLALSPAGLPRVGAIRLNAPVFGFSLLATTLAGILFGIVPGLQASHTSPHGDIQHASPRTTGARSGLRSALVVAELSLAFVLLVSSGLLLRSLQHLFGVDAGFDASHMLTMQV